jgi:N-hydroxyarylamine O-acetyltransferase
MHVLRSLGFDVKGLAARVLWNSPEGKLVPRGHMLLLITLGDQRYIADVGFGGLTLTAPLRLETEIEQQTPHEAFKLTRIGDDYLLLARVQGMWKRVYSFGLQENFLPDYEVTSWYLSNYPSSHFITGLIAARPFEGGRYVLRNNDFGTHFLNGSHERKVIDNVRDLKDVLVNIFKISLPKVAQLDDYLSSVVQPPKK